MLAVAFSLFAVLCGWLEAILYAQRAAETFSYNEHAGMTAQRAVAWAMAPLGMALYAWVGWWGLVEFVPSVLLFPAVHDEAYNYTRLWINCRAELAPDAADGDRLAWHAAWKLYEYGYQSPTTTARNDFNGRSRTVLAAVGVVTLLLCYVKWIF